jgi:two-component system, OmpR family, sensor kinase
MLANRWLTPRSLRRGLSATALAGLTTTIVLTALLFLTASSASEVVAMAQRTHERVRVYTQLEEAARAYQASSSAGVSDSSPAARLRVAEARDRLVQILAEAARLPSNNERDRAIGALIARQGQAVIEHYRASALFARVNRVDYVYRTQGATAARRELTRISRPPSALKETLDAEIQRGNSAVAGATENARSLIRTAVYAAIGGLVLALIFSLAVQYLLQVRLRPALKKLEDGARAFGQGDLDHRVELAGRDELSRLS